MALAADLRTWFMCASPARLDVTAIPCGNGLDRSLENPAACLLTSHLTPPYPLKLSSTACLFVAAFLCSPAAVTAAESVWKTVPIGGGGYVIGLVSDAGGDNIYCRTDVGGAFRWDAPSAGWVSITDHIVPSTAENATNLMSIPAIAVDPNNAKQLYVAAGDSAHAKLHGIYSSSDQGATWTAINSKIIMEGNGQFRAVGERLAVDPNNSDILWYGSSQEGLYMGTRTSGSWTWQQIPAASVPFGDVPAKSGKAGVTFVSCDKNGGKTIVYAGVYDSVGTSGGIYQSADNGTTWSKVPGVEFKTPVCGQVASNGTLYVTQKGTVGKMLRGGELTSITPGEGVSYRGITVAPQDPEGNTVFVAEIADGHHGKIFRTTDGGAKWAMQHKTYNDGVLTMKGHARTEPDGTPSITGYWFGATSSLLVHPKNVNQLWAGDFFGVQRTENAQEIGNTPGAYWHLLQKGQEETVVEALKNAPTGARLLTGVADVGGFRHLDTAKRPRNENGGVFKRPDGGSTISLDFCESQPDVWARAWVNPYHSGGSGCSSIDAGVNWMAFGQIAGAKVMNGPEDAMVSWDVTAFLAGQTARGAKEVTLVLCSGNTPAYSPDHLKFESREAPEGKAPPELVINGDLKLKTIADSTVVGVTPAANTGAAPELTVSYAYGVPQNSRWAYLKFDLSSVDAIRSAVLQLNRKASKNTLEFPVGVYAPTNTSWTEAEITWDKKPKLHASLTDPVGDMRYFDGATTIGGGRIAVSATNPNNFLWMPEGGQALPRYSIDRGATWTVCAGAPGSHMGDQFFPGIIIQQIASDRVNGNFYVAKFGGQAHVIYRSTDGGATFAECGKVPAGAWNVYRVQLVGAPAANDVWLSDDGVEGTGKGGLWRSTDGGTTWSKFPGITAVRQVTFGKGKADTGYSVFINGYKEGQKAVYRSDDYGVTWVALEIVPTAASIEVMAGDRQQHGKVFIGTSGRGVFEGQ